jgi:exodeoxyribonuclease VII large subunit
MSEKMSLSELQKVIKDSLYMALPDFYWVVAEISEIKENYAGHCYLELVEKLADELNISARARAVIWSNRYRLLSSFFVNMTGESLHIGMKILVKVRIEYHEIYGLSLVINDIDPAFTMGEMAIKRQMILKRLEEEGVIKMNKDLDFPSVPQRVAIISSKNAAGYIDFMKQLTGNSYGYLFYTALFEAPLQGTETQKGITAALETIASNADLFDVVAIIRGGGSQTDLSWFDNYNIAFYVTQFPLPVITGIGHEKDMSVTDIVAFRALKTPTAVADFLIECMNNTENHLLEMNDKIVRLSQDLLVKARQRVESFRVKLIPMARVLLSELKEQLSGTIIDMINIGKEYILKAGMTPSGQLSRLTSACKKVLTDRYTGTVNNSKALKKYTLTLLDSKSSKIVSLETSVRILDPANVLKRGYTITSSNGRIIKKAGSLKVDDTIRTKFSDGTIDSRVISESGKTRKLS